MRETAPQVGVAGEVRSTGGLLPGEGSPGERVQCGEEPAETMRVAWALVRGARLEVVGGEFCRWWGGAAESWCGRSLAEVFGSESVLAGVRGRLFCGAGEAGPEGRCERVRLRVAGGGEWEVMVGAARLPGLEGVELWWWWQVGDVVRVEEELARRGRQLAVYRRLAELALSEDGSEPGFDGMARELSGLTGYPVVTIEICDPEQGVLVYRGVHGVDLSGLPTPLEVPMDVSPSGRVVSTGRMVVESDGGLASEMVVPLFRQWGLQTYVGVPLRSGSQVIGVLSFADRERRVVDGEELRLAGELGDYLALLLDRWHVREMVRRSESELRAVYDQTPVIMCLFDPHLRIVRANRAAGAYVGRAPESVAGMQLGEFLRCEACLRRGYECGVTPDCPACELRLALVETFREGRRWERRQVRKTLMRGDRAVEVVLLVSTERVRSNGLDRVLLCLEDVTERTRAEMQIRSQAALLQVTRDAVFVRDFCDRILYWNDGAAALYGWSAVEAQGRTLHELGIMPDLEQVATAVQAVQEREEWSGEMRHRDRQGRELAVQSRWTLIRHSDGFPRAILIVNTDITEKKRLESQLLRSQRLESIGTLASGLAHDLNNVLSPILMAVQFLKDEVQGEAARTCLQTLETCAQRGAGIIRQVLTFARGVEGARVLLQLKHLVREVERIVTETFPRSIRVQVRMERQPWLVQGDPTQLQQVLMNLCVNARDAMPEGGVLTLRLENVRLDEAGARVHVKARPGPYTVMSVQDTGVGIPPELLDKIFDPFFTTKPVGQGTGLGLATVLGIVESHGGFVTVESEVGRGSTFAVYLPALPQAQSGDTGLRERPTPGRGKGQRVLVVDDEPAVRQITAAILRNHGYEPLLAADGQEALAVWEKHRSEIRAVVTDLMMPRMDGPTFLRALRRVAPDLPAISITGLGEESRVSEARAAGAAVNLDKPFTAAELLSALERVLAGSKAGAAVKEG